MEDQEIKAMSAVLAAIEMLDESTKKRVLNWVIEKFDLGIVVDKRDQVNRKSPINSTIVMGESLAELFGAIDPSVASDKALIVAAFLQERGASELTGREINDELKNLGHKIGNITKAIDALKEKKPQLMVQLRKEGSSRQAQKKYRVTQEGFKYIKSLRPKNE